MGGCASQPAQAVRDEAAQLTDLARLHAEGVLTDNEFGAANRRLRGQSSDTPASAADVAAAHLSGGDGQSKSAGHSGHAGHCFGAGRRPSSTPPPTPPCLFALDAFCLEWFAAPERSQGQDYTQVRESLQTGRLVDASGRGGAAAGIMDIRPHAMTTAGLVLAGSTCFGQYTTESGEPRVLGCVKLPKVRFRGAAVSAFLRVHYLRDPTGGECLLFMGDGWDSHFTLKHSGRYLRLEVCPNGNGWERRASISSGKPMVEGHTYSIVATMAHDGSLRLYVDGALSANGAGLSALPGFSANDLNCERGQGFCGRWMRPDQSPPVHAGLLSLALFDGEVDGRVAAALHAAAPTHYGAEAPVVVEGVPMAAAVESWSKW